MFFQFTKKDIKLLGGDENLRTKQGYYIYRNDRLIIWGTWFGLQRGELTKNARIRVDFPNSLDDIWKIDIKKQNASIPLQIRNSLKRAVTEAMNLSVKQQTHRGRKANIDEKIDYICFSNTYMYDSHLSYIDKCKDADGKDTIARKFWQWKNGKVNLNDATQDITVTFEGSTMKFSHTTVDGSTTITWVYEFAPLQSSSLR